MQAGTGQFCSSCGKPLDAPDLELLSSGTSNDAGTDVVMSPGGSRSRSLIAIFAVLAALAAAAAFSGKGTTATKTTTTTVARSTTVAATTTSTTVPETTTTEDPAVQALKDAVLRPRILAKPILPEKTGIKLLLTGLQMTTSNQRGNAIVDLDTGLVTPFTDSDLNDPGAIRQYSGGLLVSGYSNGAFVLWQPDGTTKRLSIPLLERDVGLGGDVVWSMTYGAGFGPPSGTKLIGYDLRDGRKVAEVEAPSSIQLIGFDEQNRPVVVEYGSGTYVFDPVTQKFSRLTTNLSFGVQGRLRLERRCDEQIVCTGAVLNGDADPVSVRDTEGFGPPASFSPDGRYLVRYGGFDTGKFYLESVDLTTGIRQELSASTDGSFSYENLTWSSDSRWLFWASNSAISAWKADTTEIRELSFDGEELRANAVGVFPS